MQEIPIESPLNSLESPLQSPFNSLENPTLENKASSFHGDNYKELHLDYIRNIEKSPTFLFFSHKVLPADNKPFFSYSQAFSYKSWLFLMKIEANFMRIQGFSLINNNSFKVKFDFDENISGKIALGSLNYRPYLLIPLINGMIFIIDLQSLLNNIENKPLFSIFRLNISTNFLLFLENISDLMKEHEKAWNLVFIANISNGTLRLFEASISSESLFPSNNPEIPENPLFLDFIQEISLFYSGLIGKIKNYSDYYLRNPMDSISASHYFSNFLLFIITRRFQLKIVNINTKTVIFETFLEDFANNNNNSQAKFNNIDNFIKIEILNKHPYLENEENKAFCLMAIAEIDNPLSNFIKILNFSINLKKTNRKAPFIEFSRFSNEDICLSIELINSETIKTPENSSISDFSINEKGLFIAFHDNISLKSRISYVSLRNSGLIRKTVFSRDVIIEEKSLEDEDFEAFADKSLIIERLILENRFSYETFMEFTNFEENLKKKSQIIEKIKTLSNEEIMKLGKSLDSLEKTKNRIKCLYFPDKNKGFPIVFRETSISALKSLDFIEEISENLEYSRIFLRNPLTINHLSFLSLDFPNEFLYKKPFSPQILSSIFLVKLALRISPDLLRLSFEKDNEKALSFSIFLTEHISESLSYRDYGEIRAFSLNFQDLLKSGFSGEEVLSIFLDQMIALTQKNRDFQCQKPQEIDIEDWNSLVLGFFAEDLKFSIRSYAVFCLDLLIFFKVFLQITPEETGNLGFILKIEALAQLSQFLMANSEVLKQIPSSETRAFDIARLWNFDIARLWIYENSKELLGNPSNFFDFSKPNSSEIAISGFAEKIKSFCLYFEGFERIDIDFIPNLLRFCAESLDFLNFDKMKAILGIKNPSIEFLKALLLSKRVENAEIIKENSQKSENSSIKFEKALNYVNSFVNIDFLPEFQDRDLLCLGPWFIYQQVDELQKTPDFELFFSKLPLDVDIFSNLHKEILRSSDFLLELLKNDLETIKPELQENVFLKYKSEIPIISLLMRGYLSQNSFEEASEILIHHIRKLLGLTYIEKAIFMRETYLEILGLCQKHLELLIFVFSLPKSSNPMIFYNEKSVEKPDFSMIFSNNKGNLLKKSDFHKLLKKIEALIALISKIDFFESQSQFPIEISSEELLKGLIKVELLEEAVNLVIVCQYEASNLLVFLIDVYYRLSENRPFGDYTIENIWDFLEEIIDNCAFQEKTLYLRTLCEKMLRNNLQRNRDFEELPAYFIEKFRLLDPNGLTLLYMKYRKFEKAGFVVFNYIRESLVRGNKRLAAIKNQGFKEEEIYIAPNVILTVMNYEGNEKVKIEIEKIMENLAL